MTIAFKAYNRTLKNKSSISLSLGSLIPFFIAVASLAFFLFAVSQTAYAGVMVFDDVSPANKTVKLKALTKGRFFAEGGKLADFYVNGDLIGTTLSGGDGYAFLKYTPSSPGIKTLTVDTDNETDEGVLLITGSKDSVILVTIENTLFESLFSLGPAEDGKNVVQQLSKNFSIIYLTTHLGVKESRKWLEENEFPLSAVFKWEGAGMIADLQERDINLYAIIGTPGILAEAQDIKKRYSFQETEGAVEVKDWDDLLKQLQ